MAKAVGERGEALVGRRVGERGIDQSVGVAALALGNRLCACVVREHGERRARQQGPDAPERRSSRHKPVVDRELDECARI
jgi:hypothetical protein